VCELNAPRISRSVSLESHGNRIYSRKTEGVYVDNFSVAGWNDLVADKHEGALRAFLDC